MMARKASTVATTILWTWSNTHSPLGHSKQIDGRQTHGDTAHEATDSRLPATHANTFLLDIEIQDEIASSAAIIICVFKIKHFDHILAHGSTKTSLPSSLSVSPIFRPKQVQVLGTNDVSHTRQLARDRKSTSTFDLSCWQHFLCFCSSLGPLSFVDIFLCMRFPKDIMSNLLLFLVLVSCTYALLQLCL